MAISHGLNSKDEGLVAAATELASKAYIDKKAATYVDKVKEIQSMGHSLARSLLGSLLDEFQSSMYLSHQVTSAALNDQVAREKKLVKNFRAQLSKGQVGTTANILEERSLK